MKTITVTCLGVLVFLPSFGGYAQIKTDTSLGHWFSSIIDASI